MEVTFTLPDDMRLRGLEQTARGWRAYVGPKNSLYLQGDIGATAQEAIDAATARVRRSTIAAPPSFPDLELKL